jgi:hypothetical protein
LNATSSSSVLSLPPPPLALHFLSACMSLFQTAAALEREGERKSWRNNSFFFTQSKCNSSQIAEDKTSNWKETKEKKKKKRQITWFIQKTDKTTQDLDINKI